LLILLLALVVIHILYLNAPTKPVTLDPPITLRYTAEPSSCPSAMPVFDVTETTKHKPVLCTIDPTSQTLVRFPWGSSEDALPAVEFRDTEALVVTSKSEWTFSESGRYLLCYEPTVGLQVLFRQSMQPTVFAWRGVLIMSAQIDDFCLSRDATRIFCRRGEELLLFRRTTEGVFVLASQKFREGLLGVALHPSENRFWWWCCVENHVKLIEEDHEGPSKKTLWQGAHTIRQVVAAADIVVVAWDDLPTLGMFHGSRQVQLLQAPRAEMEGFGRTVVLHHDGTRLLVGAQGTVLVFEAEAHAAYTFPLFVLVAEVNTEGHLRWSRDSDDVFYCLQDTAVHRFRLRHV